MRSKSETLARNIRILTAALVLASALLACDLPAAPTQTTGAATIVAQTMDALLSATPQPSALPSPAAGATATGTPASTAITSTAPAAGSNPLPHSLYFLNNDKGGLLQIFRLERDGQTLHQITFEPANVDGYDVSPKDGSVVYISNNQMLLVDANGAGRRLLVDGGPVDDSNRFTNSVGTPVWSPDGARIAFGYGGLNLYTASTGAVNKVLENQIDTSAGFPVVRELYWPNKYSPDGSNLLIVISFNEGGTFGIYHPSDNTLLRFTRAEGGNLCCNIDWVPDGSGLYAASPTMGMIESGLWYINPVDGKVTTLLPGAAPDSTYNFADAPQVGSDGNLYFFFNNLAAIPTGRHTPLFLVRSGSDGVTGRTQLKPEAFDNINEVLWAPDASLAVAAFAPTDDVVAGGRAEIVYPDARPNVLLASFAEELRWGP